MRIPILPAVVACALTVAFVSFAFGQRGPQQPPMVKEGVTEKISEHVYVIPDGNVGMVPNVSIIVGKTGTFVVDTGLGARNGQAVMREVDKVSRTADLYLASTHFHPEHDLGANGFPPRTKMIRSRDQLAELQEGGLEMAKRFASFSPAIAELLEGADFRKADILFDKEHVVDLGGVRVRLIAMGTNHTRGDTAFFVESDRVLASGDVVMSTVPGVGGTSRLSTWLASMDRFEKLQPRRVVPSHGPMGDATMIANAKTFLTTVQARAAELKKQGRSADETLKLVQDELQSRYDRNRMAGAIRAAYNEAP